MFRFIFYLAILSLCFGKRRVVPSVPRPSGTSRSSFFVEKIRQLTRYTGAVVMIDGDNVRGKSKFSFTKEQLCNAVSIWAKAEHIQDRVVIFFDHANCHEAFILNNGCVIVFSGPTKTADDIISRDVTWIHKILERDVIVITEDQQLKARCRKSSYSLRSVHSLASSSFVEILSECVAQSTFNEPISSESVSSSSLSISPSSTNQPALTSDHRIPENLTSKSMVVEDSPTNMSDLIMRANLVQIELQLQQKITELKITIKKCSRKQKPKLRIRLNSLEAQLEKFIKTSNELNSELTTSAINDDDNNSSNNNGTNSASLSTSSSSSHNSETLFPSVLRPSNSISSTSTTTGGGGGSSGVRIPSSEATQLRAADIVLKLLTKTKSWEPEQTWERVVLAENFRLNLKAAILTTQDATLSVAAANTLTSEAVTLSGNESCQYLLQSYVDRINANSVFSKLSEVSQMQEKILMQKIII